MKNIVFFILFLFIPIKSIAGMNTWVDNIYQKYRQDQNSPWINKEDGVSGSNTITVYTAKNAFADFQVLIYADGEPLTGVDIAITPPVMGGNSIEDVYLYKQNYIQVVSDRLEDDQSRVWDNNWNGCGAYCNGKIYRTLIGPMNTIPHNFFIRATPTSAANRCVSFYYGGLASTNWHQGVNQKTISALSKNYDWYWDGTYLYVWSQNSSGSATPPNVNYSSIRCPEKRSKPQNKWGMIPDALMPKIDRLYNERRLGAWPNEGFPVSTGQIQGFWVEIGTTQFTKPGVYTSKVTVTANGKQPQELTAKVVVWDFTLQSSPSYITNFRVNTGNIQDGFLGHTWNSQTAGYDVNYDSNWRDQFMPVLMKFLLYHRLSARVAGEVYVTPHWDGNNLTMSDSDFSVWENMMGSVLDGTAITKGTYSGAKLPMYEMNRTQFGGPVDGGQLGVPNNQKQIAFRQYLQYWYDYLQRKGRDPFHRAYMGTVDEPKGYQCTKFATDGKTCTAWDAGTWHSFRGQNMLDYWIVLSLDQDMNSINTHGYGTWKNTWVPKTYIASDYFPSKPGDTSTGLSTFSGTFVPVNYHYECENWDRNCINRPIDKIKRDVYPNFPNKDGHNWAYTSNMAFGGSASYDNTIDFSIDPSAYSLIQWAPIFYEYQIGGLHYWELDTCMDANSCEGGDSYFSGWDFNFGGYGDGHMIYPGIASKAGRSGIAPHTPEIGGTHDIPIGSIRLSMLRSTIQDIEIWNMAEAKVGRQMVKSQIDTLFPLFQKTYDPAINGNKHWDNNEWKYDNDKTEYDSIPGYMWSFDYSMKNYDKVRSAIGGMLQNYSNSFSGTVPVN